MSCVSRVSAHEVTQIKYSEKELTWDKIHDLDVITDIQSPDGLINYQYDVDGNRVKKMSPEMSIFILIIEGSLSEEQFNGHIVKYISQNNSGDIRYIGCEIDGTMYTYERDEMNFIVGLLNCQGERILSYRYDENGALEQEIIENDNEAVYGLNHIIAEDKYWDAETGWYYYYKSYWNPKEQRFLSGNEKTVEEVIAEFGSSHNK